MSPSHAVSPTGGGRAFGRFMGTDRGRSTVAPWAGAVIAAWVGYSTAFLLLAALSMGSVMFAAASVPRLG